MFQFLKTHGRQYHFVLKLTVFEGVELYSSKNLDEAILLFIVFFSFISGKESPLGCPPDSSDNEVSNGSDGDPHWIMPQPSDNIEDGVFV